MVWGLLGEIEVVGNSYLGASSRLVRKLKRQYTDLPAQHLAWSIYYTTRIGKITVIHKHVTARLDRSAIAHRSPETHPEGQSGITGSNLAITSPQPKAPEDTTC